MWGREGNKMTKFTKRAIKNAFIELLRERPLSQITVKDIVRKCGISRNSFYYHFHDIPSLIEEIVLEEADKIISEYKTLDSFEMGLNVVIDFVKKNRREILHIYQSVSRDIFEEYLWKVCDYIVVSFTKTIFADRPISKEDREIIVQFYKAQYFGLVISWLRNGMKDDVHRKIHRLCQLQKGIIEEMIGRSIELK